MLYTEPPRGYAHRPVNYGPYSPSRLIVARCPQRFFGQYIRKDKSVVSTIAAARGSAIHHVLSKITDSLVLETPIVPSQVSAWVSEAIGMFPSAYEEIDLVRGAAQAYLSNPSPYLNKTTSCEKAFAVAFYEEDSFADDVVLGKAYVGVPYSDEKGFPNQAAFFGGRLDQVTVDDIIKTVTILDHKSTPSANKNEDHNFQMGAYAWLVSLFYPGYRIRTVIHYANPALNFYGAPEYWSQEELSNFETYIHSRIWAIENFQDYPAMPGSSCDYCHMVQECPMNLALREQKARGDIDLNVRSHSDLPKIAGHLRAVGALYDELNKALKKGIETYAPNGVGIEGMWYGFKVSDESVDWISTDLKIREESERAKALLTDHPDQLPETDRKRYELMASLPDLAAFLNHWGVDSNRLKEWKSEKFKNLLRTDNPGLIKMLKEYAVKNRSTRFGGYKS